MKSLPDPVPWPSRGLPAMSVTGLAPVPFRTTRYWSLVSGAARAKVMVSWPRVAAAVE